jgi:hypothetical protein
MNNNNDISNNIIDISNNENTSITNLIENIYNEASIRRGYEQNNNNNITTTLNNQERSQFFSNNDNSFNNVLFNNINPLLVNSSSSSSSQDDFINSINNQNSINFNIEDIFQNLITNIRNNSIDSLNINNIFQESFQNDTSIYKKVLSEKGKSQLKQCLFKDSSKNNTSCPIFFIDFKEEDEIIELPCLHCFLPDAINKWLTEENAHCPVCRYELESEEKKKNNDNNDNNNEEMDEEQYLQQAIIDSFRI